jgi:hypothetical protein
MHQISSPNTDKVMCSMLQQNFPVTLGCGGKISENCTYFQSASSSQAAGQCGVTICKCSSDICQVTTITKGHNEGRGLSDEIFVKGSAKVELKIRINNDKITRRKGAVVAERSNSSNSGIDLIVHNFRSREPWWPSGLVS